MGDGEGSISLNRKNGTTLYKNSVVLGNDNEVIYAHATALGDQTQSGWRSTTEGYLTYADNTSHAEGRLSQATGLGSHAEGTANVSDFSPSVYLLSMSNEINGVSIDSDRIKVSSLPSKLKKGTFILISQNEE